MSKALQTTFLVHAIVALILGVPLLILPGTFLKTIGWVAADPMISRLLGAALLALAWGSFRGWRATERTQVRILLELEAVFTVLGSIGLLRHLVIAPNMLIVWVIFLLLAVFAVAWVVFLFKK
jgi:hypothetical protein